MQLDKETLNKIAHLARLEFNEKDTETMLKDMSNILSFVEKLNEVNTEGVEPLTTMSHEVNALREDKTSTHLNRSIHWRVLRKKMTPTLEYQKCWNNSF